MSIIDLHEKEPLLCSIPADFGNDVQEFFSEGLRQRIADAVHEFFTQHSLSDERPANIMTRACAVVKCIKLDQGE